MKHWDKKQILSLLFIGTIISSAVGVTLVMNYANTEQKTASTQAASSIDNNCREGVYWAKSQKDGSTIKCGRAPECGGYSYDSVNSGIGYENAGACWLHRKLGVDKCDTTCSGYVPLCCYKLEETGDPEACTWPERGYCHPTQCAAVSGKTCGGGDCRCGSPIISYCKSDGCITSSSQIPYIPLSVRLGQGATPTSTPTSIPPTSTPRPTTPPAATATPTQGVIPTATPTQPQSNPTGQITPTSALPTQPGSTTAPTAAFTPTTAPTTNNNPPESFPTSIPEATSTPTPAPTMDIKTPKELAREVITYERVETLNKVTELPLTAVKTSVNTVKSYDHKLELFVESWIFRIRIELQKLLQ